MLITRFLGNSEEIKEKTSLIKLLKKIYFYSDLPAMCLSVALGLTLLLLKGVPLGGWFHMKMTFTLLLVALDVITGRALFAAGNSAPKKYFRYLNFLIYLFLFAILFSVYVLKP